jgi:hypothetical protein
VSGLTFLNVGFWPWLLALSLPVAIHLLTRQARRVYVLPTFQFLQRSLAQQSRVFRLRRRLLLALRMLLVLCLVLAFLKPTLTAPLAGEAGTRRAIVLVLDTSLSMGYLRGGVSSLARARAQAATLLEDLRPGDVANVILAAAAPSPVLPQIGGDFGTLRQTVKSAEATPERGDMPAAIALAAEQLAKTSAHRKELLLASDFQRTNWADVKFDALPADTKIVFLDAAAEERDNTAITDLKLRPSTPHAGEEASVIAEVWNGTAASRTLPVTLTLQRDEATPAAPTTQTQVVTVPPYASGTVTFPVPFPDAGRYRLTAHVPPDNLPADDTRYLVADLRHGLSVLLLTDADLQNTRSAAYYLYRALNPMPNVPGGLRVLPKHVTDLSATDLQTSDMVLLDEVTTLPADRLPLLRQYVSNGGALIVFLTGPRVVAQMQALARLNRNGEGLAFLPQMPVDVRRQGKGYITLTEARYDSPLLALFKDPGTADLGKIRFTRFFLTGEADSHAEVLLKYEDGTPAAARRNLGAGSILLCNFSPAPADSDLARQEVFPPLLHEFIKGMTAKEDARREFYPGGSAATTLDGTQVRGTVTAVGPESELEHVTVDRTGGGVIIERVETPGFHTVLADGQAAALLAVNPHPDESDLRPLDPHELESKRSARPTYLVHAGEASGATLEGLRHGRPLWPYCLLAAFVALLLEQAVATFGGQARLPTRRNPSERISTQ